jgi:hypothetical protein
MLVSGVIASTLLISALTIPLFIGVILIAIDRQQEQARFIS